MRYFLALSFSLLWVTPAWPVQKANGCAVRLIEDHALTISVSPKPQSVGEIAEFVQNLKDSHVRGEHGAAITQIQELKNVFIAVFEEIDVMSIALDRATTNIFFDPKHILSDEDLLKHREVTSYDGHDLYSVGLRDYLSRWEKERTDTTELVGPLKSLRVEAEFWDSYLIPKLRKSEANFVLIAAAADKNWYGVLSHEILHAQFAQLGLKKYIDDFWKAKIGPRDQAGIRKALRDDGYNVDQDDNLLKNEFYAYVLEARPEKDLLGKFSEKYRESLIAYLSELGITPLKITR